MGKPSDPPASSHTGPTLIWRIYGVCDTGYEANASNVLCSSRTALPCTRADGTAGHLYNVQAGMDEGHMELRARATCLGPREVLDTRNMASDGPAMFEEAVAKLPKPIVEYQPAGRTLANLDTIVYASCSDAPIPPVTVAIDGASVTLHITRTLTWSWGDGSDPVVTDWCGRPFDGHTIPRNAPDMYITHKWMEVDHDGYPMSLTITYTPRYDVVDLDDGTPLYQDLTSDAAVVTSTAAVPVYEAMAQLVSGQ